MNRNYESLNEALEHYIKKYKCNNKEDLLKIFENFGQTTTINKPKYIYINTLVHAKKEILNVLKEDGFVRVKPGDENEMETAEENENKKYDLKILLGSMKNNEFVKDEHIKKLYIFTADSLLNKSYNLFKEGHLLQIDKSSCLVPLALNPPPESHCIDAASCPVFNFMHCFLNFIYKL